MQEAGREVIQGNVKGYSRGRKDRAGDKWMMLPGVDYK